MRAAVFSPLDFVFSSDLSWLELSVLSFLCLFSLAVSLLDPSFSPPSLAAFLASEFSLCGSAPRPISCFHRRFALRALDLPNRFLTSTGRSAHTQFSAAQFLIPSP
jgi:hypothetical protein